MPQVKKPPRRFTPEEIERLKGYSAIRLPIHQIAALFKVSLTWFEEIVKKDAAARNAISEGRASASHNFRVRLYQKAVTEGDVQAMKFWAVTQEGFRTTESIELSGPNQQPIEIRTELSDLTSEQLAAQIRILKAKLADED